jgi:hypothetical protein
MPSQSTTTLLKRLKSTIEKIEYDLSECKKNIELLEKVVSEESLSFKKPVKSKTIDLDPKAFVAKIEDEFKNKKYDSLSWLISSSKISVPNIITLLNEGGIILPKSTKKTEISDKVKQILSTRYSFSRT